MMAGNAPPRTIVLPCKLSVKPISPPKGLALVVEIASRSEQVAPQDPSFVSLGVFTNM